MKKFDYHLVGLAGFVLSGAFFTLSSWKSGDNLALAGSIVWLIACFIWMIPTLSNKN